MRAVCADEDLKRLVDEALRDVVPRGDRGVMRVHWCGPCVRFFQAFGGDPTAHAAAARQPMPASTVPAAKQAILNLLTARAALNTVAVTWSQPTEQEDLQDEMVFFDGPIVRQPEFRVMGGNYLDETYTLTLMVRNRVVADDAAAAEARCWQIVDEIEQSVRQNPTLGGILSDSVDYRALDFGEQEVKSVPLSDGWYGEGVVPLICHARI
jgi:hypothetical protein